MQAVPAAAATLNPRALHGAHGARASNRAAPTLLGRTGLPAPPGRRLRPGHLCVLRGPLWDRAHGHRRGHGMRPSRQGLYGLEQRPACVGWGQAAATAHGGRVRCSLAAGAGSAAAAQVGPRARSGRGRENGARGVLVGFRAALARVACWAFDARSLLLQVVRAPAAAAWRARQLGLQGRLSSRPARTLAQLPMSPCAQLQGAQAARRLRPQQAPQLAPPGPLDTLFDSCHPRPLPRPPAPAFAPSAASMTR
jgi:hypothetical protein